MQRLVLATTIALLSGCAERPATAPAFPDAPPVADADPELHRTDGDGTVLVSETKVDPTQLYAELTAPLADTPMPGGAQVDPAAPTPAPLPELAGLLGDYRYRGGRSSVRRSIDGVVDRMSVFVRGIARKRLVAANRVPHVVSIAQQGDDVTVVIDGRTYTAELGGASRRVHDENGEPSRLRYRQRGNALYQIFAAPDGDRTNVFTPRDDGGIDMAVRISSSKLPADVRYRLSFEPE